MIETELKMFSFQKRSLYTFFPFGLSQLQDMIKCLVGQLCVSSAYSQSRYSVLYLSHLGKRLQPKNILYSCQSINNYRSFYPCNFLTSYISRPFSFFYNGKNFYLFIFILLYLQPATRITQLRKLRKWIIIRGREHQMRLY